MVCFNNIILKYNVSMNIYDEYDNYLLNYIDIIQLWLIIIEKIDW